MVKGTEKCSPCMLSRHVVHLGILKWTWMRESSPSILKLDKSLSHLRNLRANINITKMQNLYKCTEGVVAKLSQRRQSKQLQTMIWFSVNLNTHVFMEAKILFPIPKDQDQIRGKHLNFVFTNVVQYQGKHSTYPINDLYKTTLDRRRDK
jgi:hypothetical protein